MARWIANIAGLLLIAAAVVAVLVLDFGGPRSAAQEEGGGQQERPPPTVEVAEPLQREIVDYNEFTGRFIPVRDVVLQARVSGYLTRIAFTEGQSVREGDLLYQIDPRPFQATLASAEAELRAAQARRALARVEAERARTLASRQIGSEQEYDRSRASFAEAVANVSIAEAAVENAELELEFTRIVAPISGRISATRVDVGNLVTAGGMGMEGLATIVSTDPVEFTFAVSEAQYLDYVRLARSRGEDEAQVQMDVQVRLMDEEQWAHQGRMTFLDNRLDPNSGTIEGRATFRNPDRVLTPGVFGRLRLPASRRYEALLLPDEAIVSDQSRKLVYIVDDEDNIRSSEVRLGPLYEGLRVIREGVEAGDRVVVSGLQRAQVGKPVTPMESEIEAPARADG